MVYFMTSLGLGGRVQQEEMDLIINLIIKLYRVCPVDNRPSTEELHHLVTQVTHDTQHVAFITSWEFLWCHWFLYLTKSVH